MSIIKLKSLINESLDSALQKYYDVREKMEQEWFSGTPHQSWRLVPKKLLSLVWLKFIKYGRVDEKGLDKIWEIIEENCIKIFINSNIRDGDDLFLFNTENDKYDEVTEEEWTKFFNFISDRSGPKTWGRGGDMDVEDGHARYSDSSKSLMKLVNAVDKTKTPEEKLIAIDQILNFVHGIGDMAKWFVEGGWQSLQDLNDREVKGIHLKGRLTERKLDISKKEDAAEFVIRSAWKIIPNIEDRYTPHDLFLWIDNNRELNELAIDIASKFYPNDDEPYYQFQTDIENVLFKLDADRISRKRKKNPSLADPLYVLKKLMFNTGWEQSKTRIMKISLSGHVGKVSDDEANETFDRLYRNAMGETYYDISSLEQYGYGKLSNLKIVNVIRSDNIKQYNINMFLNHYGKNGTMGEKVRCWRGTNNPHSVIRPGDFVTFDRGYAQNYMRGKYKTVINDILNTKDLVLVSPDLGRSELVYWPEGHQIKKYEGIVPSLREFWEEYRYGI